MFLQERPLASSVFSHSSLRRGSDRICYVLLRSDYTANNDAAQKIPSVENAGTSTPPGALEQSPVGLSSPKGTKAYVALDRTPLLESANAMAIPKAWLPDLLGAFSELRVWWPAVRRRHWSTGND